MIHEPPAEAVEHFDRAMGIEAKDGDTAALNERAVELALAINKAGGVYPPAHAMLGVALAQMGDEAKARQELNMAIRQENCNSLARAFLILLDMDKLGVKPTVRTGDWADFLFLGGEIAAAKIKIGNLTKSIDELAKFFPIDISESTNIQYWFMISDLLLSIHDDVHNIKALSRNSRLASAVFNAPWQQWENNSEASDEDRQKIRDIKRRAEGRILLTK